MNAKRIHLGAGAYAIDGELHIDVSEMIEAAGYVDTPENRRTLILAAKRVIAQRYPGLQVHVKEHGGVCRHGEPIGGQCVSCEMLRRRPDKRPPPAAS